MGIENYDVADLVCDHGFQQYCLGSDEQLVRFWSNWIESHPEKAAMAAEAKVLFQVLSAKQGDINEQLAQLKSGLIHADTLKEQVVARSSRKRLRLWVPTAVAAGIALFLLLSRWMSDNHPTTPTDQFLPPVPARKTVALPDGSVVVLAGNSEIRVDTHFNHTNRTVYLSGQAYFDVKPAAQKPFIVLGKLTRTEVLGTAFTVKEDAQEGTAEIALLRGKVQVNSLDRPEQIATILPTQRYIYQATQPDLPTRDTVVSVGEEATWMKKTFDFDNSTLATIAEQLGEWYGIDIRFTDEEVKSYRYTGYFQEENVLTILETLQLSYPFQFQMEGNVLHISN